jgi:hypothetical protein
MTTFVCDKFTNVSYCVSDGRMVNPLPSPPILGFLQLSPTLAKSLAIPEVLTSIVSTKE